MLMYSEPRDTDTNNGQGQREGDAILTAIDKSVVILLIGFVAVSGLCEHDESDTFGAASGVVVQRDGFGRADGRGEELLW
jgi:hypothetical protein